MSFLRVLETVFDELAWTRILAFSPRGGLALAKRACEAVAESGGDAAALKSQLPPAPSQRGSPVY